MSGPVTAADAPDSPSPASGPHSAVEVTESREAQVGPMEETTGVYTGEVHGIQLWVAQPEATRHAPAAFEHHGELPRGRFGDLEVTLLVGQLGSLFSPARRDTDHLGAGLDIGPGASVVPARPDYEYALIVLEGRVEVAGAAVVPGQPSWVAVTLGAPGNKGWSLAV